MRRRAKPAAFEPLTDTDKTGVVEVRIEGEHNSVHVHQHVYHLSENPRALRATRDTFLPLGQDGFDKMQVREGDKVVEEIDWPQVESIVKSCNVGIEEAKEKAPEIEVETTPAWLSVYSPVFDPKAPSWRFRLGKDVIYADISETDIASRALERGVVNVEDAYQVNLQITTEVDEKGAKKESTYKVLDVVRFIEAQPHPRQSSLFDDDKK